MTKGTIYAKNLVHKKAKFQPNIFIYKKEVIVKYCFQRGIENAKKDSNRMYIILDRIIIIMMTIYNSNNKIR